MPTVRVCCVSILKSDRTDTKTRSIRGRRRQNNERISTAGRCKILNVYAPDRTSEPMQQKLTKLKGE